MIQPLPAPVRPRVVSPDTDEAIPLEEFVESFLETSTNLVIEIVGPPGSGKTTALRHLAAVLSTLDFLLLDEPDADNLLTIRSRVIVYTTVVHQKGLRGLSVSLVPWTDDDLIEYLLAVHPGQCGSVMQRIQQDECRTLVDGEPELWRMILDRMAADASTGIRTAIRGVLDDVWPSAIERQTIGGLCLRLLPTLMNEGKSFDELLHRVYGPDPRRRWLHRRAVQVLSAADSFVELLAAKRFCDLPQTVPPRPLVEEIARLSREQSDIVTLLRELLDGPVVEPHPTAASILHAADMAWQPPRGRSANLEGAYLDGVKWARVNLAQARLAKAHLNTADLTCANLQAATLDDCQLRGATLQNANLWKARLVKADLSGADLAAACASACNFSSSKLRRTNFAGANLTVAEFDQADCANACFRGADLSGARLLDAAVDDADFSSANLRHACLLRLVLRNACLDGANFRSAHFEGCDLEFVRMDNAQFEGATFMGVVLTGSIMPGANFQRAIFLQGVGLAEIEWEGADLRGADLRGCTFHMSSSRSGLVGSPYPGHGSRTGFYTDPHEEQYFKSPEEIRKANLRGADLHGAKVDGVDFYLVDLRDAKYDAVQAEHFRRCDAILFDREGR